jgi:hypothetical protein
MRVGLLLMCERVENLVREDRQFGRVDTGKLVDFDDLVGRNPWLTSCPIAMSISTAPEPSLPESGFLIFKDG